MDPREPVTLLALDVSGTAGVARAVVNLANHLVRERPVRVISVLRRREQPAFPLDPGVEQEVLIGDPRRLSLAKLAQHDRPTRLRPKPADTKLSRLTDRALRKRLGRLGPGVLISSRPSLHLAAVTWAAEGVKVVGWDHKNFPRRFADQRQAALLRATVPRLDAYVVLTNADAEDYVRELPQACVRVIRNVLSTDPAAEPASLDTRVVLGAGRLVREKGFDRLLAGFAPVARDHPEWRLRLHGQGKAEESLRHQAARLGIADQVDFAGYTTDMAGAMAQASVFALTSRSEGLPMVLLEAMSQGLPLVAMDCQRGPGEIVHDGKNGFLVDDGDVAGFTAALRTLVERDDVRRRCGRESLEESHRYDARTVIAEWKSLLDRLDA